MNTIDLLDNGYNRRDLYTFIVMVGTGGTGGYLVQHIAQMMSIFKQRGQLVIADPDIVEEKNLNNQLFVKSDIGKHKAEVLANRYRSAYQIPIGSYSKSYIENVNDLKSLFNTDYINIGSSYNTLYLPIVIGAVDNNYTRKIMNKFFNLSGRLLYIDVGNESVTVPIDYRNRPINEWTEEEKNAYDRSGWSGQVVCGLKIDGKVLLPPVGEVFPDIMEDKEALAPSELACSDLISSDPQRLLTNRMAAMSVVPYLNQLFENGTISNHITFFHAKKGYMKSQEIK